MKLGFDTEMEADMAGMVALAGEVEMAASRRFSPEGERVKIPALKKAEAWRMKTRE